MTKCNIIIFVPCRLNQNLKIDKEFYESFRVYSQKYQKNLESSINYKPRLKIYLTLCLNSLQSGLLTFRRSVNIFESTKKYTQRYMLAVYLYVQNLFSYKNHLLTEFKFNIPKKLLIRHLIYRRVVSTCQFFFYLSFLLSYFGTVKFQH